MKNSQTKLKSLLLIMITSLVFLPGAARASDESDVRSTVQRVFEQLKSRDYSSLYDVLPSSARARLSRDRFTTALAEDVPAPAEIRKLRRTSPLHPEHTVSRNFVDWVLSLPWRATGPWSWRPSLSPASS